MHDKEGFKKLGHEITNENPDLIFSNDPLGYQDAVFLKNKYPNIHSAGIRFLGSKKYFETISALLGATQHSSIRTQRSVHQNSTAVALICTEKYILTR